VGLTQDLEELRRDWDELGSTDPLWAVLSHQGKRNNQWNTAEFFELGVKEIGAVIEYVRTQGFNLSTRRALDFGCGVGRLTQALADYFEEVYGVDIAATMLEAAGKFNRHGAQCKFVSNTTGDLSVFPDRHFDFIYSNLVLHHMDPRYAKRYIEEFARVLATDGVLVFQIMGERFGWRAGLKQLIPSCLLHLYYHIKLGGPPKILMFGMKYDEVVAVLTAGGAKVVDVKRTMTASGWVSYRYCVVRD
jgi:ubiquinone/menaquinone biosynthesis C-methylase UbiE